MLSEVSKGFDVAFTVFELQEAQDGPKCKILNFYFLSDFDGDSLSKLLPAFVDQIYHFRNKEG